MRNLVDIDQVAPITLDLSLRAVVTDRAKPLRVEVSNHVGEAVLLR
jgi:hypothetical protein